MKRSITRVAGACVVALAIGLFTGTALAGNGNGNSANAPGQQKQDASTPPAQAPAPATPQQQPSVPPGQAKKESPAPAASTAGHASPGQQKQAARAATTTPGVKPSNTTKHNTMCSTGGSASSPTCTPGSKADSSKQYGNGKTAAQIAASRGAPAGTTLKGPGNSQPHKVVTCKHPHGVDVHAVKSYSSQNCATAKAENQSAAAVQSTPQGQVAAAAVTPTVQQAPAAQAAAPATQTPATQTPATPATTSAPQAQGGVLGATATLATPKPHARGGVLGTLGTIAGGNLPFTGFPVWLALLVALVLVSAGVMLRRGGSSPTRL